MQIVIYSSFSHMFQAPADGSINFNQPTRGELCVCVNDRLYVCQMIMAFLLLGRARDESRIGTRTHSRFMRQHRRNI